MVRREEVALDGQPQPSQAPSRYQDRDDADSDRKSHASSRGENAAGPY